jgi:hypothetical protein
MAVVKKPKSKQLLAGSNQITTEQQAFISDSLEVANTEQSENGKGKVPVMLRVDPDMLKRIDRAAKELGLKRAAFIVYSTMDMVKRRESDQ